MRLMITSVRRDSIRLTVLGLVNSGSNGKRKVDDDVGLRIDSICYVSKSTSLILVIVH